MYSAAYIGGLSVAFTTGGQITFGTLPALGAGVWALNFRAPYQLTATTNISNINCLISTGILGDPYFYSAWPMVNAGQSPIGTLYSGQSSGIISIPNGTTYTFSGKMGFTFVTAGAIKTQSTVSAHNYGLTATRIA
jgi:hypothetical protein